MKSSIRSLLWSATIVTVRQFVSPVFKIQTQNVRKDFDYSNRLIMVSLFDLLNRQKPPDEFRKHWFTAILGDSDAALQSYTFSFCDLTPACCVQVLY